jgi:hypothetical protein
VAIRGSIEEAGLPNVLQVFALGGKTGRIAVEQGTVHGAIYLDAGTVIWAEIVSAGDRLGDHLVRSGKITREQLRHAIEALTQDAARALAEVLVDSGSIARGELDRFVQHQVEEAVYLMFSWTKGQFIFTPSAKPPRHATCVSLHADRLLLEAGRRADDWTVIHIAIPSFDRVYRRATPRPGTATSEELTSEQHRILPLLDGTRDVNGIIELSGMSAFEVGKALLDLITAGLVQLAERRSSARHLDEAELLAYSLRSGEFADSERRKDAARHIADCTMCGGRLREVHGRRTQETATQQTGQTTQTILTTPTPQTPQAPPLTPVAKSPGPPLPEAPAKGVSRLSKDIIWLTSPQEADAIRRSVRAVSPPPAAAVPATPVAPVAAKPPAPPAATPATPPPAPAEQPPVAPRVPRRALALAAAGAVVVLGGWVALRSASRRSDRTALTFAANAPLPTTAAPVRSQPESITPTPPTAVASAPVAAAPATAPARRPAAARDSMATPPTVPLAPDAELAGGGWRPIDRAEAINLLGGRIGAIPGLRIESITTSEARGRSRVRLAQITRSGQRIVLIETAGAEVPSSGAVRATAVSVMAPLEASGESIGSASLGNLQITARSRLTADGLRPLLARLAVQSQP